MALDKALNECYNKHIRLRKANDIEEVKTMKKLNAQQTRRIAALQAEYNRIYDVMGYTENKATIAACNRALDKLVAQMDAILAEADD